jgi:glycosyltransferase involved in cell wall biosynthesis
MSRLACARPLPYDSGPCTSPRLPSSVLKLTTLAPYVPSPAMPHAGGVFLFHYLHEMAHHAAVTLVAPATPENEAESVRSTLPCRVVTVPRPGGSSYPILRALTYPADVYRAITIGWWIERAFHRSGPARAAIASADLVEIQWTEMARLLGLVHDVAPDMPTSLLALEVLTETFVRRRDHGRALIARLASRVRASRSARVEAALLDRADLILAFSYKDLASLSRNGVDRPGLIVPPWISVPANSPPPSTHANVLFVGAMNRPENSGAVDWFLEHVWPSVRKAVPAANFVIAGAKPPHSLRNDPGQGVQVTGFVTDLEPLYADAAVVVAPLQVGSGVKFKVLEAMARAVPVVASSVGAEGIEGPMYARVDDPSAMAEAVVSALTDRQPAVAAGAEARRWVLSAYDFPSGVERIARRYQQMVDGEMVP